MIGARLGAVNKLGYIAAHSAIVLICLGGLFDGDLIIKAQVWNGLFQTLDEATRAADVEMVKCFDTDDFREGVAHFLEKRAPAFTGR